jgi:hypothetical protein
VLKGLCNQAETLLAEQRALFSKAIFIKTRAFDESACPTLLRAPLLGFFTIGIFRCNLNLLLEQSLRVVELKKSCPPATLQRPSRARLNPRLTMYKVQARALFVQAGVSGIQRS